MNDYSLTTQAMCQLYILNFIIYNQLLIFYSWDFLMPQIMQIIHNHANFAVINLG